MNSNTTDRNRCDVARHCLLALFGVAVLALLVPYPAGIAMAGSVNGSKASGPTSSDLRAPFKDCDQCPEMVVVPSGTFVMGSPAGEPGHGSDETPRHEVRFSQPFAVGRFEVTNGEWNACVVKAACPKLEKTSGGDRHPATGMSWHEAQAYVAWLSKRTGKKYRLLSEAEWEYAARAGTTTAYHTGVTIGPNQANVTEQKQPGGFKRMTGFGAKPKQKQTMPVGSYSPNGFGLYDVHGNVGEWTQDCVNDGYAGAPTDGSPWLSGKCHRRIIRGGAWVDYAMGVRSAVRNGLGMDGSGRSLGLRVARSIE